jgi:hypothetical protein
MQACLADETAAQNTLKQNWSKYAAGDQTQCIGMETTGGPASYVELLSRIEIMRDARDVQNADPLENDLRTPGSTRPRRGKRRWSHARSQIVPLPELGSQGPVC